jgi:antitoxin ParD1/3/4
MYIQLKPEQEQFIQAQMANGRYENADDVINEAFKLLEERERRLEQLRQKIAVGTEQIAQGRVTDGEVVFARLQEKIRKIAEKSEGLAITHFQMKQFKIWMKSVNTLLTLILKQLASFLMIYVESVSW